MNSMPDQSYGFGLHSSHSSMPTVQKLSLLCWSERLFSTSCWCTRSSWNTSLTTTSKVASHWKEERLLVPKPTRPFAESYTQRRLIGRDSRASSMIISDPRRRTIAFTNTMATTEFSLCSQLACGETKRCVLCPCSPSSSRFSISFDRSCMAPDCDSTPQSSTNSSTTGPSVSPERRIWHIWPHHPTWTLPQRQSQAQPVVKMIVISALTASTNPRQTNSISKSCESSNAILF